MGALKENYIKSSEGLRFFFLQPSFIHLIGHAPSATQLNFGFELKHCASVFLVHRRFSLEHLQLFAPSGGAKLANWPIHTNHAVACTCRQAGLRVTPVELFSPRARLRYHQQLFDQAVMELHVDKVPHRLHGKQRIEPRPLADLFHPGWGSRWSVS